MIQVHGRPGIQVLAIKTVKAKYSSLKCILECGCPITFYYKKPRVELEVGPCPEHDMLIRHERPKRGANGSSARG